MKKVLLLLSIAASFAHAESQDECSIWLCLPSGFPAGCEAAHSAMISRIKDEKSPLPPFSACSQNDSSGSSMNSVYSHAAYVPAHDVCVKTVQTYNYSTREYESKCVKYQHVAEQYMKGKTCQIYRNTKDGPEIHSPAFCSRTVRYIDVIENNQIMGDTYYFN